MSSRSKRRVAKLYEWENINKSSKLWQVGGLRWGGRGYDDEVEEIERVTVGEKRGKQASVGTSSKKGPGVAKKGLMDLCMISK